MARSTYVWTVVQTGDAHPAAVFTVKRELATWWALWGPAARARCRIWRHYDARPAIPPVDVTHELEPR